MRRSTRNIVGGLLAIIGSALAFTLLHHILSATTETAADLATTPDEASTVARFEAARRHDALRHDSLRQTWASERRAREEASRARAKAWADSQHVWAERREQWAAARQERAEAAAARQAHYDSLRASQPHKLPKGTTIDANTADSLLLIRVPGIGPYYASRIIAYRKALGGFVSPQQIEEIEVLPHGTARWFTTAATPDIAKRNINRADFKTLVRHPYLNYEQTKAIVNLRQRSGNLRSWDDLRGSGLFNAADIERLTPYFNF